MTSKPVSMLLTDLGVNRSHSRPHVSNDNPFSDAQYRTLKYLPDFPDHFESLEQAKQFCTEFFYQYNYIHGIPASAGTPQPPSPSAPPTPSTTPAERP